MSSDMGDGQKGSEAFISELKELLAANLEGNVQLLSRLNALVRATAKTIETGRPGEVPNASAMVSKWLDFGLASYSVVSQQSLGLLNGLLSAAEQTFVPHGAPASGTGPATEPRVELRLSGRPGERVTSAFLIENNFDTPLDIVVESEDLVPASGAPLPGSHVAFEPARLTVAPRHQEVVRAAVTITSAFVIGQTYRTTVRLSGHHGKEVGLEVTVLPPEEPAEAPSKARGKRAAKARRKSAR